jgi:alpha-beta hydrolase superfamily lysophospholipase
MYANHIPAAWDLHYLCVNMPIAFPEKQESRLKKRFLYGFSMGGTVVLQLHRKDPLYWDGAVLLAPFCKAFNSFEWPNLLPRISPPLTIV